jgi:hypothetical protein
MSGTVLNRWAMSGSPRIQAEILAKRLGCLSRDSNKMAACLKKVHPHRIARLHKEYLVDSNSVQRLILQ